MLARQLQLTRVAKVLELLNKIIADSGDPANRPLPASDPTMPAILAGFSRCCRTLADRIPKKRAC